MMNSTVVVDDVAQSASFEEFMSSLRDPAFAAPIVSARRFSGALHIDQRGRATVIHAPNTFCTGVEKAGPAPIQSSVGVAV
jgi:hypothetical protein